MSANPGGNADDTANRSPMRLRSAALAATAGLAALTTVASALNGDPRLADYEAFHGSLGLRGAHLSVKHLPSTPQLPCAKGGRPETGRQGRVPLTDYTSGRAAKGYTCNATDVGHEGDSGGFQVHRYVDKHGHECAFY